MQPGVSQLRGAPQECKGRRSAPHAQQEWRGTHAGSRQRACSTDSSSDRPALQRPTPPARAPLPRKRHKTVQRRAAELLRNLSPPRAPVTATPGAAASLCAALLLWCVRGRPPQGPCSISVCGRGRGRRTSLRPASRAARKRSSASSTRSSWREKVAFNCGGARAPTPQRRALPGQA
jgi:hypothetical protein